MADLAPQCGLLPPDPAARARVRLLQTYSDRIAGQGLREVIFAKRGKAEAEWDQAAIQAGMILWRQSQEWLDRALGDQMFMGGAAFTLADCALLPRFSLAERYGAGLDNRHPNLSAWFDRVRSRSSYSQTVP